ncbi:hypothetical protein [Nitrosomonas aestuarii]|uniref:hypothetical protein n=1 Tax=Nitrosomonas aestuarii TaxID=52441 RepID=UPI000D326C2C|nr:hypothetical protein [Nitrosomonas aestuarii]PTN10005.1 hypothetical protein C8R11_12128 [Nitrosomonas aestuarii]
MNIKKFVIDCLLLVGFLVIPYSQAHSVSIPPGVKPCPGGPVLPPCGSVPPGCPCRTVDPEPEPVTISISSLTPQEASFIENETDILIGANISFSSGIARVKLTVDDFSPLEKTLSSSGFVGKRFTITETGSHTAKIEATLVNAVGKTIDMDSTEWEFTTDLTTGIEVPGGPKPPNIFFTSLSPEPGPASVFESVMPILIVGEAGFSLGSDQIAELVLFIDGQKVLSQLSQGSPIFIADQFNTGPGIHTIRIEASVREITDSGMPGGILASDVAEWDIELKSNPVSIILDAQTDTYIRTDLDIRRNDNYGMQEFIMVGTGRGGDSKPFGAADAMRALIRFDNSLIPRVQFTSALLEATLHSFDGSQFSSFTVDIHRILDSGPRTPWVEGTGFEGTETIGKLMNAVDPDTASGVAWAGGNDNPDPEGANNLSQPDFDPMVIASNTINNIYFNANPLGSIFQWDITSLVQGWSDRNVPNAGLLMRDATTDGEFRGLRLGANEGLKFMVPGAVKGPRLVLSWSIGSIPGDITGNNCVDLDDLNIVLAVIRGQAKTGPNLDLDFNSDGAVNIADARKLITLFSNPRGAPCGPL